MKFPGQAARYFLRLVVTSFYSARQALRDTRDEGGFGERYSGVSQETDHFSGYQGGEMKAAGIFKFEYKIMGGASI